MTSDALDSLDLDYDAGRGESPADYPTLADKLDRARAVVREALVTYRRPAVLWTGGKDSTLVLWVVREVATELGTPVPPAVFIDHFQHFPETRSFVERWAGRWDLELIVARNEAVAALDAAVGDRIDVRDLDAATRRELDRLEYEGDSFVLDADTLVGNHLLKTVALNDAIRSHGFDGVLTGVRWDEAPARADETFFSPRHDPERYPPHDRVHPILQFDERAVWAATWTHVVPDAVEGYPAGHVPEDDADLAGFDPEDVPVSPKYFEGYRSLGTRSGSGRSADGPAWTQDLDAGSERAGRSQDKEDLMDRLRDLGYM